MYTLKEFLSKFSGEIIKLITLNGPNLFGVSQATWYRMQEWKVGELNFFDTNLIKLVTGVTVTEKVEDLDYSTQHSYKLIKRKMEVYLLSTSKTLKNPESNTIITKIKD